MVYGLGTVIRRLEQVGCDVIQTAVGTPEAAAAADGAGAHARHDHGRHDRSGSVLTVVPPSWRPDLTDPADLAEEVIRLEGYEQIPVRAPRAAAGRGLTERQRLRRTTGRSLAATGFVEAISYPFVSPADFDRLLLPADDPRREALALANPLSDDEPLLRTVLLPGLLRVLGRNIGRGFTDLGLFETGLVFRPGPDGPQGRAHAGRGPGARAPRCAASSRPRCPISRCTWPWCWPATASCPAGGAPAGGPDGRTPSRPPGRCSRSAGCRSRSAPTQEEPWHPGRCAALIVHGEGGHEWLAGHAGELHPRVTAAFGLPARTAAAELDMSVIETAAGLLGPVQAPEISGYPVATQDVALIVADTVPAGDVAAALTAGAARGRGGHRAGGPAAVRRLHRRPGRRGAQVPGLHPAVPGPGPHPHRRRGQPGPRGGGRRGRPPHRRRPPQLIARPSAPRAAAPAPRSGLWVLSYLQRGVGN